MNTNLIVLLNQQTHCTVDELITDDLPEIYPNIDYLTGLLDGRFYDQYTILTLSRFQELMNNHPLEAKPPSLQNKWIYVVTLAVGS